jgi:membrane protease YdiL (CAAX protease family)
VSSEPDPVENDVVIAEIVSPLADAYRPPNDPIAEPAIVKPLDEPRIWTALVVGILTLPIGLVVSIAVMAVAMFANLGLRWLANPNLVQPWLEEFMMSRTGFLVMVLPGQLVFLGMAFVCAWLSPVGMRERLRLSEGRLPMWTWLVLGIGTPALGILSSILMTLVFEDMGEQLEMLNKIFRSHRGWFVAVLVTSVAILPGLGEEALFRGYVQSRLLLRLPPLAAITISSLLFSIAHIDPHHVLAVIPLGFWLGIVAWRSDSIWPSVVCHMINNAVSIAMTYASDSNDAGFEVDAPTLITMAVSLMALIASILILVKYGGKPSENVAPTTGTDGHLPV